MIDEEGNMALLKRVQGVKATSGEPQAVFPTKVYERKPEGQRAYPPGSLADLCRIPRAVSAIATITPHCG